MSADFCKNTIEFGVSEGFLNKYCTIFQQDIHNQANRKYTFLGVIYYSRLFVMYLGWGRFPSRVLFAASELIFKGYNV